VQVAERGALLVMAWTIPVIIGTSGHFFDTRMEPQPMPAVHVIGHSIATWYPWIVVTPLMWLAFRRLPRTGAALVGAVAVHALLLAAVYMLQAFAATTIGHVTGHVRDVTTPLMLARMMVAESLLYDLLIYLGLLAAFASIDLARRYRDRDRYASQMEAQLRAQLSEARFAALQMQLQPHFLFNALNSIAMLVRRQQSAAALEVIVGFSELLRYLLDEAGTIDVPLSDEVRFATQYLEIERVRHGERLVVSVDVPPEVMRALVPNLLLQPLVENAIKHGIATRTGGGAVSIAAARDGAQLVLTVRNEGPRLPHDWSLDAADGVGLRNVRARLAATVGEQASLVVCNSADGTGVEARVRLPYRTKRDVVGDGRADRDDSSPAAPIPNAVRWG
jgi:signal transduction histidine kinase